MQHQRLMAWIERMFGCMVAACMLAMTGLMFVDVVARKLLNTSVPGGVDLIELLMLGVVFAGLPVASLKGEHIVLDMLNALLPAALAIGLGRLQVVIGVLLFVAAAAHLLLLLAPQSRHAVGEQG